MKLVIKCQEVENKNLAAGAKVIQRAQHAGNDDAQDALNQVPETYSLLIAGKK